MGPPHQIPPQGTGRESGGASSASLRVPGDVSRFLAEPELEFSPSLARPSRSGRRCCRHPSQKVEGAAPVLLAPLVFHRLVPDFSSATPMPLLPPPPSGAAEPASKLREGDGAVAVGVQALEDRLGFGRADAQLGAQQAEVVALDSARAFHVAGEEERAEPGQVP